MMRVCVIGAGAGGICAARHLLREGHTPTVFEKGSDIGGTWVYEERVGLDRFGLPLHTSMYKNLRANFPTQIMTFPDHPPDAESMGCFVSAETMLSYLRSYADRFRVRERVKFEHHVVSVKPSSGEGWQVTYVDLSTGKETSEGFDVVMVCNGHYSKPRFPKLPGIDSFEGTTFHSHDYRTPEVYARRKVVVIGAGFSGMDIALDLAPFAERVLLSHRLKETPTSPFPDNLELKPEVESVSPKGVRFVDGSVEDADVICYCTGYDYDLRLLDETCGVTVTSKHIKPLYKHLIHAERPTLCFVGLPIHVVSIPMMDLQVRYYMRYLKGELKLPSEREMREQGEADWESRRRRGLSEEKAHWMGAELGRAYYRSLSEEAGVEPIPPVFADIHRHVETTFFGGEVHRFRQYKYTVVDKEKFTSELRP